MKTSHIINRWRVLVFVITVLALLGSFSNPSLADTGVQTTTAPSLTSSPSRVDAHFSKNAWIYTKIDDTGYAQLYLQHLDSSAVLTPTTPLNEYRLTTSAFNKSNPKWGPDISSMYIYTTYPKGTKTQCEGDMSAYYLGDSDSDGSSEIHFICIDKFPLPAVQVIADVKLTGWDTVTNYNVTDYDVPHYANTAKNLYTNPINTYGVVFTADDRKLHILMHEVNQIAQDISNLTASLIVYDYSDSSPANGPYVWASRSEPFSFYSQPRFDAYGYNIVFVGQMKGEDTNEIGTISVGGFNERQLTDLNLVLSNPQFIESRLATATSNPYIYGISPEILFEVTDNSITRLARFKTTTYIAGTTNWCNVADYITDDKYSRQNLVNLVDPRGGYTYNKYALEFAYTLSHADGLRDIYASGLSFLQSCAGVSEAGTNRTLGTTAITEITTYIDGTSTLITDETQLTCLHDNTNPVILPSVYYDDSEPPVYATHSTVTGRTDIVMNRTLSDTSEKVLVHLFNVDKSTGEECDSCYEDADGSPIEDINGFEDGDGNKDSCEEVPQPSETPACNPASLLADPTGDFDGDGIT
ncbi:MAG TPA: hypothetical protein VJC18_09255, partial [bacterium]|nr:hypothetical protein [bacterium]